MIKVIKASEDRIRIIKGPLLNDVDIDWSQPMEDIKQLLEFAISLYGNDMQTLKNKRYSELRVYEGGNHIDIIDHGKGSLNLLFVEEHNV